MENIKIRTLAYDVIIILIFSFLFWICSEALRGLLCGDCFMSNYGPAVNFISGLLTVMILFFLNHSKNKKEPAPKWYTFMFYIIIAVVIFIIINAISMILGEMFYVSSNSSF